PACIAACPEDVQTIGPRNEIIKQAKKLAKETNGFVYGENENGGTNTIYVSPVRFEQLNEAIEKGKGKPHLNKVKDMMALGNNLALAMLIAPVAGAAAAFGKFYKTTKEEK
ncbi:MAG: 4Fe-4S ferredoxin, partial [Desulfobacteraceae bacterium]|nr:4Fe-4S ferredoxin [Desulfobacteraceae bacterium]